MKDRAGFDAVPWPKTWSVTTSVKLKLQIVGAAALALFLVTIGALLLAVEVSFGWAGLVIGALMVTAASEFFANRLASVRRTRLAVGWLRTTDRQDVTFIPYTRASVYIFRLTWLIMLLFFLSGPFLAGALPDDDAGRRADEIRVLYPWLPILAPLPLFFLSGVLLRKRREIGIGLALNGVYHWSWFGCSFFPWEDIRGVSASEKRGPLLNVDVALRWHPPGSAEENWLSRKRSIREGASNVRGGYLAVNPAAVLYALAFYGENPDQRRELGTNAAMERIKRADFPGILSKHDQ